MLANGLGKYNNIDQFVKAKIDEFTKGEKTFNVMFELMFSEKNNTMYESSNGFKIEKKTYQEVYDEILRLANDISKKLICYPKGSVIGLYLDNSIVWIELFWAIIVSGYNPLLLNMRLDDDLLNKAIIDGNAKAVISQDKTFSVHTIFAKDITLDEENIEKGEYGSEVLVMSSGTTDSIKICGYSAEELYYQICNSVEIIKECKQIKKHYKGELKLLTVLPFYHIFGLTAVYIWFAFFSRTFVQLNNLSSQTLLNTVKKHKVTHIFAVPLFWDSIYNQVCKTIKSRGEETYNKFQKGIKIATSIFDMRLLRKPFSKFAFKEIRENLFGDSIQFLISGGSNIPKETLAFFNCIGYRLANGYGMTEIGITSVELSEKKKYLLEGSVGKPLLCCEYKLSDDGELLVCGKSTAKYIIEKGIRQDNASWYNTHDLATEKDGHYEIISRKDDVIVTSNGENVNPTLIEPAFKINGTQDVCLIKKKKGNSINPLLLIQVDRFIDKDSFEKISSQIKDIAIKTKFPKDGEIEYTTTLLVDNNDFKLNRMKLSKKYENNEIRIISLKDFEKDNKEKDELKESLLDFISIQINKPIDDSLCTSDLFLDLGITSFDYYSLIALINEEYDVIIPLEENQLFRTIEQIYNFIKEQKNK